jgi:diguanylate cyclase (GGDEF)-like protein
LDTEAAAALSLLVERSEQPVSIFDDTDTLRFSNRAFQNTMGLDGDERIRWTDIMRRCFAQKHGARIETDDFEAWLASARSRRGKMPFRVFEADLCDGRWVAVAETIAPNGWMLCVFTNVTHFSTDKRELRQALDRARRASLTDELTGISNRRHLLDRLGNALHAADGTGTAVVLIDMDHFKRINDQCGHAAGDAVLRHFALLMQGQLRREDVGGRMGGEEFLLVLRNTDISRASELVQRLLERAASATALPDCPSLRYSFSAGIAQARPGESVERLLRRADEAMYRAKSDGRGCFRVAP